MATTGDLDGAESPPASLVGCAAHGPAGPESGSPSRWSWRWLALGASLGGPAALLGLLAELPASSPLRVVIVQHIAPGFEGDLAEWLAASLALDVRLALDGERPPPGSVRVAPAYAHLRVTSDDRFHLATAVGPRGGHRPSVDELFLSLATAAPHDTAAALLTGTGRDGAAGLAALRRAGAFCFAQDEASSAAFGMPRAAFDLGAAELVLSPEEIGRELARRLTSSRPGDPQECFLPRSRSRPRVVSALTAGVTEG